MSIAAIAPWASPSLSTMKTLNTHVYYATHENPWLNLATEDFLFQHAPTDAQILFLWRNRPSVVIGRAQNPWLECQLSEMERDQVLLARRQSGGGAVYHDLGNTNFTFISPRSAYDKNRNFQIVLRALKAFGISAIHSKRNDLLIDGPLPKKISGNAFRENKDRAFHHGTLLLNADLNRLTHYLAPRAKQLEAKGVKSVRAAVMNLSELNPQITHETISEKLISTFFETYRKGSLEHITPEFLTKNPSIQLQFEEYESWDWRYGKTLPFTHTIPLADGCAIKLEIAQGKIEKIELEPRANSTVFEQLNSLLIGMPYRRQAVLSVKEKLSDKTTLHYLTRLAYEID